MSNTPHTLNPTVRLEMATRIAAGLLASGHYTFTGGFDPELVNSGDFSEFSAVSIDALEVVDQLAKLIADNEGGSL